jgi:hypothetical protein
MSGLGSSRARADRIARSAQSSLGFGCCRRSTATSCRSAHPALLRAAGRDPDRPADRLRLALAGLPAGRRSAIGGDRSLGGQPFLTPSGWSIGIIVFAGLLLGWSLRLGPQGVVQVPVSALLVFAVDSATPDYGGRRIVETLIGSAIAVLAVLVSPSAPAPERVVSDALTPLHRCRDLLTEIGSAIGSAWTLEQAEAWRTEALGLFEATARARRDHQGHQLTARWNARARRQRLVFERADEALRARRSARRLPGRSGAGETIRLNGSPSGPSWL